MVLANTSNERYQRAEEWRKAQRYEEAEVEFRTLYREHPAPSTGWRWAFCLRKMNRSKEALDVASEALRLFPQDRLVASECAWATYAQEVKPDPERDDLGRTVHFAEQMLNFVANDKNDLVTKLAVFGVLDVAKKRGKWDVVVDWCRRLDPESLDDAPVGNDPKKMSDRLRWYFAMVKGLINTERWDEAREMAAKATGAYPRRDDFARWAALARAGQNDLPGAIAELEALIQRANAPWYLLSDLAELLHRAGRDAEGLRFGCKAALAFGEDKAKVNLFALLGEIGLLLDDRPFAAINIALAKAVRIREGWPIKPDLIDLERRSVGADTEPLPTDVGKLAQRCLATWRQHVLAGQPRYTGTVSHLPVGKMFGFIAPSDGGESVFALLRDLPRPAQNLGVRVEYSLEKAFDQKKNRETVRAADIVLCGPSN